LKHLRPVDLETGRGIGRRFPFEKMRSREQADERSPDRMDHHDRLMCEKRDVEEHLMQARREIVPLDPEVIA
jgi:hypothetical protein